LIEMKKQGSEAPGMDLNSGSNYITGGEEEESIYGHSLLPDQGLVLGQTKNQETSSQVKTELIIEGRTQRERLAVATCEKEEKKRGFNPKH